MPDLPHPFREAALSSTTSEAVITLLKLSHPAWDDPLLLSDYPHRRLSVEPFVEVTTHDGEDYVFAIASVAAPGVAGSALPESTIVVANLDGEYDWLDEEEIEDVSAEVIEVLKSDPEIVVRHFQNFVLTEVAPDDETLTVTLGMEHIQQERFPAYGMSKVRAPALFRT